MEGRVTIDGYYKGNEKYELITHGGQPDPKALCSLRMSIYHNDEVEELLKIMQKSIREYIDTQTENCMTNSINRALQGAGIKPLNESVITVILKEYEFQKALEFTEE